MTHPPAVDSSLGQRINGRTYEITLARYGLHFVGNIRLFKQLTVYDNIPSRSTVRSEYNLAAAVFQLPQYAKDEREIPEKTEELLEIFGLHEHRNEIASSLPYGEQRQLEIAGALATNPEILLLDEPAAGYEPSGDRGAYQSHPVGERAIWTYRLFSSSTTCGW